MLKGMSRRQIIRDLFILFALTVALCAVAWRIVSVIAAEAGTAAGKASVIAEVPEIVEDAREDGLDSSDRTQVELATKMQATARFNVLTVSTRMTNYTQIGDAARYAALYLYRINATYSINLSAIDEDDITVGEKIIYVELPNIEVSVSFDNSETEKVAEWQSRIFNGSTQDGFEAAISDMSSLQTEAEEELLKDNTLMELATNAAEEQVELLFAGLTDGKEIVVRFSGEE